MATQVPARRDLLAEKGCYLITHMSTATAKKSILPVKENFDVAWASPFPHLTNLNTRVKFGRAVIKIFISNSSGNLLSVWKSLFSMHAILEAQKQFKILEKKDLTEPCSQKFCKVSGIPCSHMIGEILEECGPLEPEYFHPQWHLDYNLEGSASNI
ncbi:uncharacterized protein VP01_504g5 [Puccinia sorghi]|uniref:Uncharacterized protein n=1 Tax=Puccinia sorghi TaxID=27349 RepID=A0A0L6UMB9_9BASI|nr:uncharacterized protein VP01_504g5 [Puccinia sorghi]